MSDNGQDKSGKRWRVSVVKPRSASQGQKAVEDYNSELAEVLREKNVFRFRNFLAAKGRALPDDMMLDTLKMATLMHQMILSVPELADQHDFSRQWLDENTFVQSSNRSLNEAAKREPGLPPPPAHSRTINLKVIPPNPEKN